MPNFQITIFDRRPHKWDCVCHKAYTTGAFIEEVLFKARHKINNTISPANHPLTASNLHHLMSTLYQQIINALHSYLYISPLLFQTLK